jgi:hypothetical protein
MKKRLAMAAGLVVGLCVAVSGVHGEAKSPEQFVLSGVLVLEGGRGLAWLQEPVLTGNRVVTVHAGDAIGPYRVAKIFDDHVELDGPTGKVLVPLSGPGGAGAVASTAPQPANPPGSTPPSEPPHVAAPLPPLSPEAVRRYEENTPIGRLIKKVRAEGPVTQAAPSVQPGSAALTNPRAMSIIKGDPTNQNGWRALFGGR